MIFFYFFYLDFAFFIGNLYKMIINNHITESTLECLEISTKEISSLIFNLALGIL